MPGYHPITMKRTLLLLLCLSRLWSQSPTPRIEGLTLLFINDLHGQMCAPPPGPGDTALGGMARLAHLVRTIRRQNAQRHWGTRFLVAGDILQGTPLSTMFQGAVEVDVLNALEVDALVLGNHELDFGFPRFRALRQKARFPIISSNVLMRDGSRLLLPGLSLQAGPGLFLNVWGCTTPQLATSTDPTHVQDLGIHPPRPPSPLWRTLFAGTAPWIVLSHCEESVDRPLIRHFPGLLLLVGGHEHLLRRPPAREGEVLLFQTGERGRYLGRVDLPVRNGGLTTGPWDLLPVSQDLPEEPDISALIKGYTDRLDKSLQEVLGTSPRAFDGERPLIRCSQRPLGRWLAALMRQATHAEVALLNSGTIRASLPAGPLCRADLLRALPFPNELMVLDLDAATLCAALERGLTASAENEDGGYLQLAGLELSGEGLPPANVRFNGLPLDPGRRYRVVCSDFMSRGGDGYPMLKDQPALKTGLFLRDLLEQAVREGQFPPNEEKEYPSPR